MEKICWQITVAAFMQPFQYDLRDPAAKDNSITNAATARSNLDAAIYTAGTILQLQSTMEFHRQLIHQHHLQSHLHCGNDPRVANHNGIPSATHPPAPLAIPFTLRERSYSCKSQWNSVDRKCTKNTWNPIYNAEPIRTWSETVPTTHETVSHPSHRRGRSSTFGDGLCMEKHRVSCICYLSKTHFVRDFHQNSIGNSSTSTTCNPIYSEGTILELQITMEFHRQLIHQHHLQPHLQCGNDPTVANHNGILSTAHARKTLETPFTMRNRSDHDPNMIRDRSDHDPTTHETVSQPSHRRGRSSRFGDGLCMEKHRVSCICYLSKTHFVRDFLQNSIGNSSTSTTCNPIYSEGTILELQITMEFHRQLIHQHHLQSHLHCGNDPTVANHNGILSTTNARNTGDTPFTMRNRSENDPTMIRDRSDHDPTTHETVSQPSHRRGRSSRFGDGLCMEKHRVSCICYLSKTHFVRDFLQNSIGNSSTSTTCNPIYSEGTILELQITMEFHRQLIHQHHLQPHLQCGNDPTVANHNGILSTAHARKTLETPFTMRNRSENDPTMIRDRSDHDPTTHETVSQPSHRRGRSSRFGDGLCMEKHRVSCICYLSKTHFVRDFLQNSIGNSSTSTTCNPIYSEGTILELQITMEFHRQLIHQHHLQPHLQCGNDPTVANHNGILSTAHARKTLETPFTMRNRSENDPTMIRDRSDHDPTTHETVSQPSHRRGRSSRFGDGLCMEKHRVSCICYLSKTHFVRDFLQNSIGNSSTSTTCNPIYSEGTISLLTLSVTNSFPH